MSPLLLTLLLASSGRISPVIPVAMAVVGLLLFVFGFVKFRQYRVLADTPVIPIRSVAMGLSHVTGTSAGGTPLVSPLTQVPCYYYEVQVERQVKRDNQETWERTHHDRSETPFYLQDATGTLLVYPQQAEYNLPRSFWGELRPRTMLSIGHAPRSVDASLGVQAPTDDYLRAYLSGQLTALGEVAKAANLPGAKALDKGIGMVQKMAAGVSMSVGGVSFGFDEHVYRFTEYGLPAGRPTTVLGSCSANPNPTSDADRNLIQKGQNEKTYLITTKSEEKLESSLKLQAFFMIFLGAVLILGGAAMGLRSAHLL